MSTISAPEVVAKRSIQNMESNRYDLIGKGLDYREGSEIGLLRLDLDKKHTEFYNLDKNAEELEKRLEELDDWSYEIGRIYTNIESAERLEGDFYYRNEDARKFKPESCSFEKFSKIVFGKNIIEITDYGLVLNKYTKIVI